VTDLRRLQYFLAVARERPGLHAQLTTDDRELYRVG
jgi:hypothetical protein